MAIVHLSAGTKGREEALSHRIKRTRWLKIGVAVLGPKLRALGLRSSLRGQYRISVPSESQPADHVEWANATIAKLIVVWMREATSGMLTG